MDEPQDLQFERAELQSEPAGGQGTFKCAICATPLYATYYEVNGKGACEGCRYRLEQADGAGTGGGSFLRSALAGLAAAAAGSGLYYGVRALTGYEIGLVSIAVGFMVGGAVRWGTRGKGGRGYQILAVCLTYMSISSTYLPAILEGFKENAEKPASAGAAAGSGALAEKTEKVEKAEKMNAGDLFLGLAGLFLLAAAGPVLVATQSPVLLLILGFGLWEAWKINRRAVLTISGPFQIGVTPSSVPVG